MNVRHSHAAVFAFCALLGCVSPALATDIGIRVYAQPWNPADPSNDKAQARVDLPDGLSQPVIKAWNDHLQETHDDIVSQLDNRDIGAGFRLHIISVELGNLEQFALAPTSGNAGRIQFVLANTRVTASLRTPGPLPSDSDPEFAISFDLVNTLNLGLGKDVSGLIRPGITPAIHVNNFQKTPINDSAKALSATADAINSLVNFFTQLDFEQIMVQVLQEQNLVPRSFQQQINDEIAALDAQMAPVAPVGQLVQIKMWADHNRFTIYLAPLPLPLTLWNGSLTGTMSGSVDWDSAKLAPTGCPIEIQATVQTGPSPLLDSDGRSYGNAPTQEVGDLISNQTAPGHCDYTLRFLVPGWQHTLLARAGNASIINGYSAGGDAGVGEIHSVPVLQAKGWDGASVIPNSNGRNYELIVGLSGKAGVGAMEQNSHITQHAGTDGPWAGQEYRHSAREVETEAGMPSNQVSGRAALLEQQQLRAPSNASEAVPGADVMINPQPLPPKTLKQPATSRKAAHGSKNMINPQPLPPKTADETQGGNL
jgi:hypothetical protein